MTTAETRAALIAWGEAPKRIRELQEMLTNARQQMDMRRSYLTSAPMDGMPHTRRTISPVESIVLGRDPPWRAFRREKMEIEKMIIQIKKDESRQTKRIFTLSYELVRLVTLIYRKGLSREAVAVRMGKSRAWAYKAENTALDRLSKMA